jgi:hypothetical protein
MYLLFTKSKFFFSDLICKVTKEPVSHVSIYDPIEQAVYHSSFWGVEKVPIKQFLQVQEQCIFHPVDIEPYRVQEKFSNYRRSNYDIGGLLFLGLSLLARRYLKLPLPKSNLWQATGMFMCTEWVTEVVSDKEQSLVTPWGLYQELLLHDTQQRLESDPVRH